VVRPKAFESRSAVSRLSAIRTLDASGSKNH
jgi:hypothetical protein